MIAKPSLWATGRRLAGVVSILSWILVGSRHAWADWPMYRHDSARSGYTAEQLTPPLFLRWAYRGLQAPEPAWPRSARLGFDRASQPVVAQGMVCFGDSVDGRVYALDAASGEGRWEFETEGPVRFAPAYARDRFYAVSDDGYLYCLEAGSGKMLWKIRVAPTTR